MKMTDPKQSDTKDTKDQPSVVREADLSLLQGYVSKLAQLLAAPESLQQAIREKYTVAGALPKEWQTLLELMPKTGPVLEVSGARGKWLVGLHSTAPSKMGTGASPAAAGAPTQSAPTHKAPSSEEPSAKTVEPTVDEPAIQLDRYHAPVDPSELESLVAFASTGSDSERSGAQQGSSAERASNGETDRKPTLADALMESIGTVESIDQEIRDLTEERLNLSRMALELRILDISPPFEAFQTQAISLSDTFKRAPSADVDVAPVQIVSQYYKNLTVGWPVILKSFFVASLLASSDGKAMSSRSLTDALRLLSSELNFASLPAEQIDRLLDRWAIQAGHLGNTESLIPRNFEDFPNLPLGGILSKTIEDARILAQGLTYLMDQSYVTTCYTNRAHNLILHLRSGNRLPPVDLIELRLLFSGRVTRFSGDPNLLSLGDYARALRAASDVGAEAFTLTIFLKLGFVSYVSKWFNLPNTPPQLDPLWQDIAEQASSSKEPSLHALIVSREPLRWVPSNQCAVVELDPELLSRIQIPEASICMTGSDIDGSTTIEIRKMLPYTKVVPLELDSGTEGKPIPCTIFTRSPDKGTSPA